MPSPTKENAAPGEGNAALGTALISPNTTSIAAHVSSTGAPLRDDPLQGWYDLAKPSRARLQKKSWSRKQRGFADPLAMWCVLQIYCIVLSILWGATI
jgi:hypothetical protein